MKVLVRAVSVQNIVKLKTKLFSINQNTVNLARRQAERGKMCTSQTKVITLQPIKTGKANQINQSELNQFWYTYPGVKRQKMCAKKPPKFSL